MSRSTTKYRDASSRILLVATSRFPPALVLPRSWRIRDRSTGSNTDSHPAFPIPRPTAARGDREDDNFPKHFLIHDAERELMERVSSELTEIYRPPLRSQSDSLYSAGYGKFEILRRHGAALSIPAERRQILLLRVRMKPNRLTCHSKPRAPFAEPVPKAR